MLRKLLVGAGMAYVTRRFMGNRRSSSAYARPRSGGLGFGRSGLGGRGLRW